MGSPAGRATPVCGSAYKHGLSVKGHLVGTDIVRARDRRPRSLAAGRKVVPSMTLATCSEDGNWSLEELAGVAVLGAPPGPDPRIGHGTPRRPGACFVRPVGL